MKGGRFAEVYLARTKYVLNQLFKLIDPVIIAGYNNGNMGSKILWIYSPIRLTKRIVSRPRNKWGALAPPARFFYK